MLASNPPHPTPSASGPNGSAERLADLAVAAFTREVFLTPKPGLPDCRTAQSPDDTVFSSLVDAGVGLHGSFRAAADAGADLDRLAVACADAQHQVPYVASLIGLDVAARSLCLLSAAWGQGARSAEHACDLALDLDGQVEPTGDFRDGYRAMPVEDKRRHLATALAALPQLRSARSRGIPEETAQLDALLTLIAATDDLRVAQDKGPLAVRLIRQDAAAVLAAGGSGTAEGHRLLSELDEEMVHYGICPAASGALLTVLLFLDSVVERPLPVAA
ncbi:triphosphoribosyl-dephospho-CoA synthase [Streptomyces endophyticus]|uniref:triphosphoribosyl-dephospho-CoA synthase n=1 Tax=Streptomyces endophyticus TaxID=714166 RepID=A0ABU6F2U3_9ACTN|nr:triphosphoribosyl-dephospho-CoA synthase [Streptomyces endophyticus]MEB8338332.1 triphosphoribosyl-dephospho-CoA synthase [Streptomyces endophyticus]